MHTIYGNIEAVVANVNDLQNKETKHLLVGETQVLLAKINYVDIIEQLKQVQT